MLKLLKYLLFGWVTKSEDFELERFNLFKSRIDGEIEKLHKEIYDVFQATSNSYESIKKEVSDVKNKFVDTSNVVKKEFINKKKKD